MTLKEQNTRNWIIQFFLISICFFLFSAIHIDGKEQKKEKVNTEIVQKTIRSEQSFLSIIPYKLPDYSDNLAVSADGKQFLELPEIIEFQSALQTKRIFRMCLSSYLEFKSFNRLIFFKKSGILIPEDTKSFLS